MDVRSPNYYNTIRHLTVHLLNNNKSCNVKALYEYFLTEPLIEDAGRKAVGGSADNLVYEDFLRLLDQHKLLFRLRMREERVQLRHDVVPIITADDVNRIPQFDDLSDLVQAELEAAERDSRNAMAIADGGSQAANVEQADDYDDYDYGGDLYSEVYDCTPIPNAPPANQSNAASNRPGKYTIFYKFLCPLCNFFSRRDSIDSRADARYSSTCSGQKQS